MNDERFAIEKNKTCNLIELLGDNMVIGFRTTFNPDSIVVFKNKTLVMMGIKCLTLIEIYLFLFQGMTQSNHWLHLQGNFVGK